jgi:hypothetical protein
MTRNDDRAQNPPAGAGGPAESLRAAVSQRVIVADGAMGTMLQASTATLSDFDGHEGCNEILNVTRPDIVRGCTTATWKPGRTASHELVRREPQQPR